jgi:hypothetical protein
VAGSLTTLPVKGATLRGLRGYLAGGAAYVDVLKAMTDDSPPEAFVKEHLRQLREEETVGWEIVRARLKL